jgi:hypothetical protein
LKTAIKIRLARYFYKKTAQAFQTAKSSLNLQRNTNTSTAARVYQLSFDRDDAMQVYVKPPQVN